MPFGQNFETEVNNNMNPSRISFCQDQKGSTSPIPGDTDETDETGFNEKMAVKDRNQPPPRFSTIFPTDAPAIQALATPAREFESYPQQPTRRAGIYIPKLLFWALFAIFLFESAVLFAYTVIGLVSNMSTKLTYTNGAGAVLAGCGCNSQPINISPNFFMPPGAQAPVVETTTLSASTITTSTSTSTPTPSSTSTTTTLFPAISQLANIIKSAASSSSSSSSSSSATTYTPTTRIVVVTPSGPTVKSTTILTVDSSGSIIAPRPTVTSTQIVAPTLDSRDETTATAATFESPLPAISLTLKSHQDFANEGGAAATA
jgi:hypothetical protein